MTKESIVSAFNSKGTLLKWLKHVDERLDHIEAMRHSKMHIITINGLAGGDFAASTELTAKCSLFLSQDRLTKGEYIEALALGKIPLWAYITEAGYTPIYRAYVQLYTLGNQTWSCKVEYTFTNGTEYTSEEFGKIRYVDGTPIFEPVENSDVSIEVKTL